MSRSCFWARYLGRAGQLLANRPVAASHSRGTKLPCWRAKVALGQVKQQPRPQGAFPWLWRWGPTSNAREQRPGDEVEQTKGTHN